MVSHGNIVVLTVNRPPSWLMPRAIEMLRSKYGQDITIRALMGIKSDASLTAQAENESVKVVVVDIDDGNEDLALTEGVIRRGLADVCVVSGHGVNRTVKRLNSLGEPEPIGRKRFN